MDKIWDRKSFEVGGHWPLWQGWKNDWSRRTDKSRTLKNIYFLNLVFIVHLYISYCTLFVYAWSWSIFVRNNLMILIFLSFEMYFRYTYMITVDLQLLTYYFIFYISCLYIYIVWGFIICIHVYYSFISYNHYHTCATCLYIACLFYICDVLGILLANLPKSTLYSGTFNIFTGHQTDVCTSVRLRCTRQSVWSIERCCWRYRGPVLWTLPGEIAYRTEQERILAPCSLNLNWTRENSRPRVH